MTRLMSNMKYIQNIRTISNIIPNNNIIKQATNRNYAIFPSRIFINRDIIKKEDEKEKEKEEQKRKELEKIKVKMNTSTNIKKEDNRLPSEKTEESNIYIYKYK